MNTSEYIKEDLISDKPENIKDGNMSLLEYIKEKLDLDDIKGIITYFSGTISKNAKEKLNKIKEKVIKTNPDLIKAIDNITKKTENIMKSEEVIAKDDLFDFISKKDKKINVLKIKRNFFYDLFVSILENFFLEQKDSLFKAKDNIHKFLSNLKFYNDFEHLKRYPSNSKMYFMLPIFLRLYLQTKNKYILNYIFEKILKSKVRITARKINQSIKNAVDDQLEPQINSYFWEKIYEIIKEDEVDDPTGVSERISEICIDYIFMSQRIKDYLIKSKELDFKDNYKNRFIKLSEKISEIIYARIHHELIKTSDTSELDSILDKLLKKENIQITEFTSNKIKPDKMLRDKIHNEIKIMFKKYYSSSTGFDEVEVLDEFLNDLNKKFKLKNGITFSEYQDLVNINGLNIVSFEEGAVDNILIDNNSKSIEDVPKSTFENSLFNFYVKDIKDSSKKEQQMNLDKIFILYMKYILDMKNKEIKEGLPIVLSEATISNKIADIESDFIRVVSNTSLKDYIKYLVSDNILFKVNGKDKKLLEFFEKIDTKLLAKNKDGTYKELYEELRKEKLINQYKLDKNSTDKILKINSKLKEKVGIYSNKEYLFIDLDNELKEKNIEEKDLEIIKNNSEIKKIDSLEYIVNNIIYHKFKIFEKKITNEIYKSNRISDINKLKRHYKEENNSNKKDFYQIISRIAEKENNVDLEKIKELVEKIKQLFSENQLKNNFLKNNDEIDVAHVKAFFDRSQDHFKKKINISSDHIKCMIDFSLNKNNEIMDIFYLFAVLTNNNNIKFFVQDKSNQSFMSSVYEDYEGFIKSQHPYKMNKIQFKYINDSDCNKLMISNIDNTKTGLEEKSKN